MPRSKTPPKVDAFDEWLTTQPKRSRACATCREGGEALALIARYADMAKAEKAVPKVTRLHEYLVENAGYQRGRTALFEHLRQCLGYRSRG